MMPPKIEEVHLIYWNGSLGVKISIRNYFDYGLNYR